MRSLLYTATLVLAAATMASAQVGVVMSGTAAYDLSDKWLLCDKCTLASTTAPLASGSYHILKCDATLTTNEVGTLHAGCDSTCQTCANTTAVTLGSRVLMGMDGFSADSTVPDTSLTAAMAASIHCMPNYVEYGRYSDAECATTVSALYLPLGCGYTPGQTTYTKAETHTGGVIFGQTCPGTLSFGDACPADDSGCSKQTLENPNGGCVHAAVSGFHIPIPTLPSTTIKTVTGDSTNRAVRIARGALYTAATHYPSGALTSITCSGPTDPPANQAGSATSASNTASGAAPFASGMVALVVACITVVLVL